MGKIIFLDIDGTIRDFDGYIPGSAIEAVKKAREKGHKVCISTGRPYCQIEKRILDIGFDGIISGSGSYVLYEGSCVQHKYFTLLSYIELCNYLLENQCTFELQTCRASYILKQCADEFREIGKGVQKMLGEDAEKLAEDPNIIENIMDVTEVEKMLFFSNYLSNEKFLREWGKSLYIVPLSFPGPMKWGGEISPITINKAEGIKSILKEGEFETEDVIAVGDSENDMEMLKLAAVGVAMGNAVDKLKEAADYVTDPLRQDGLERAFTALGLI